jgi:hypothetical protein
VSICRYLTFLMQKLVSEKFCLNYYMDRLNMAVRLIGGPRRLSRSIMQMKPNTQFQDHRLCVIVKFRECCIPAVVISIE